MASDLLKAAPDFFSEKELEEYNDFLKQAAQDLIYSMSPMEKDPLGKEKHASGAKLDDGKILADDILRMFARALWAVCEVGTRGAKKYTLGGWQHVENGMSRYANAQMRHKLKEWMGEEYDPDPEIQTLHAAQDAWNALARLELLLREKENQCTIRIPTIG